MQFMAYPFMKSDSVADFPWDFKMFTALTGYLTSPLLLIDLTASIASTAIFAKKSESLSLTHIPKRQEGVRSDDFRRHASLSNID
jgi:hypothetical protein